MASRKLVGSFFTLNEEYHALQRADLLSAAKRSGFEVEVLDAEENAVLQIHQLFQKIHAPSDERPLAFLVHTRVPDGLERVARNAAGAGIGWILLNRTAPYVEALRREYPRVTISAVAADNDEIGRIQARQFRAILPSGGSVLYVQGPPDTAAAQARLEGMNKGIVDTGIIVKVLPAEWTESSGEMAVAAWLRLKTSELFKPDLVGCQNDALALGARRALQAHRPEWARVPFTGCDGLPQRGQRLVTMKELAATIKVAPCTGPAVDLLDQALKTDRPPPERVLVPPQSFPPIERIDKASTRP
ncbi:MAG TPA: substrate-binding domain-containing protein [Vicinamibacteria bacterium]|nr:substrate-binding domain-containing protein [Vicinamibacteria bacterium]